MTDREHERIPYAVQVEFRTASSFLVAYSVNLSRGGMFLETDADVPTGALLNLELLVPGAGLIHLVGMVTWRRGVESPDGPAGVGIEFQDVAPQLGAAIDTLVASFHGVQILVLSGDRQDRTTLARSIKSIISTAEILQAADAAVAATLLTSEIDLAVVDVDFDPEGAAQTLHAAKLLLPRVPTIAITSNHKLREYARAAGADEIASNPPPFAELQVVMVRALSKPAAIRTPQPA
ncbi:MAG TPA: TIGR02266 family protein [Kofleriaceae bacterium]|nr:TIGR02266 family protein [Kofleriaceae bacterium]